MVKFKRLCFCNMQKIRKVPRVFRKTGKTSFWAYFVQHPRSFLKNQALTLFKLDDTVTSAKTPRNFLLEVSMINFSQIASTPDKQMKYVGYSIGSSFRGSKKGTILIIE